MTLSITQIVLGVLGIIAVPVLGYFGVRYTSRQARRANAEDREAAWNAAYRNAVEPHLYYDIARANDIQQLRTVVNNLELRLGMVPTTFPEIPDPPPLFPKLDAGKV